MRANLPRQASFTEEITGAQNRDYSLLAAVGNYRELDLSLLDVEQGVGRVRLQENRLIVRVALDDLPGPGSCRKVLALNCGLFSISFSWRRRALTVGLRATSLRRRISLTSLTPSPAYGQYCSPHLFLGST